MAYRMLVGLVVRDAAGYARYREAMTPLLHAVGGRFAWDFDVARTLAGEPAGTNRVFVLEFPDEATKDAFFADPAYLRARAEHFEPAVAGGGILGAWHST